MHAEDNHASGKIENDITLLPRRPRSARSPLGPADPGRPISPCHEKFTSNPEKADLTHTAIQYNCITSPLLVHGHHIKFLHGPRHISTSCPCDLDL